MFRLLLAVAAIMVISLPETAMAREDDYLRKLREKCTANTDIFVIAVLENDPPFSWTTTYEGKKMGVYGIGPMILKQLLEEDGIKNILFVKAENQTELENKALYQQRVDATIGVQYTPKLDVRVQRDFVKPSFLPNPIVAVFSRNKAKKIEAVKDLYALKGAYVRQYDLKKIFPSDLPLDTVGTTKEGLLKLRTGELDYMLTGYYVINMELKKFKVQDEFVVSEKALRFANPFITISENSPCRILRNTLSEKIKALTSDKDKMGALLYRVYQEYDAQNKNMPHL